MNTPSTRAMGLHALANDIATGQRLISCIRWYHPEAVTGLRPVPVLPDAVHTALCPSTACLLQDDDHKVIICAECEIAIELTDAA